MNSSKSHASWLLNIISHHLLYFVVFAYLFSFSAIAEKTLSVESVSLNGTWQFKADKDNIGLDEKWFSPNIDDSKWESIGVPGTWNEGQNVSVSWDYEGIGWYRHKINVPKDWQGENIRLRFLAIYLISDAWLNGKYLGNHKGGYTEFSFDVSDQLNFPKPFPFDAVRRDSQSTKAQEEIPREQTENILTIRVDNTKRAFQVPGASIDWWNCGGITRDVFLEKHPNVFLKKMFITTQEISNERARLKVKSWFGSKLNAPEMTPQTVSLELMYEVLYNGKSVFSQGFALPAKQDNVLFNKKVELVKTIKTSISSPGESYEIELEIDKPRLWSIESPDLYTLNLSWKIGNQNGKRWLSTERFGIRKIEARGTELLLNGKKIWLQGIAFHQDYAGMGSAVTYQAQRSDLERIKKLNANFVRLGHYPFHPYSLKVCDEIGLLVWSEIPVWQNSREELANETMWQEWVKPQLDEMIEQNYNHPSIVFWSVANEISQTWDGQPEAPEIANYVRRATDYVRQKDSSRLVSYASAASTGGGTWQFLDVNGKPLHYGWFHSPNVYDIGPEVDKIHSLMPDQPILAVELCGMSYPDNHKGYSEDERFSVEYHDKLLRVDMQHLMIRKDFVCGVTLWTLADLKGGREKGTYGILDRERKQVKHIYETIKNLYSKDPKILIIDCKTGYKPGEKLEVELWSFNRLDIPVNGCKIHWWIKGKKGKLAEGYLIADIKADSANKLGTVSWNIPENESGFHSLFCTMEDENEKLLFINDYYFDVGSPEKPAILWVKVTEDGEKPTANASVIVDGFTRITDEFGRVPFLLNSGKYKVIAKSKEKTSQTEAKVESGKVTEISF